MTEYKIDSIVSNAVVFASCMNYDELAKYKKFIQGHCVSLINELNALTSQIQDCVSLNASISNDSYLASFESLNNTYAGDNNRENISNIINLASDIRDSELEIFSEESFDGGTHLVSSSLLSIVESDNKSTMNIINNDKSRFSAYVSELDNVLNSYHLKCENLKSTISKLVNIVNAINLVMNYITKELHLDKNKLNYFVSLGVKERKQILLTYLLKNSGEVI